MNAGAEARYWFRIAAVREDLASIDDVVGVILLKKEANRHE